MYTIYVYVYIYIYTHYINTHRRNKMHNIVTSTIYTCACVYIYIYAYIL